MGDYDKALLKCLVNELEARYHKAQAKAWKNRARQLKDDNLMLLDKVEMLQRRLARYRHKVIVLMTDAELAERGLMRLPVDADGVTWTGEEQYAKGLTHYHAPTVEDVLREFAQEMSENMGMYTGEAIDADEWRDADARTVEKYAARLELREVGA